MKVIESIWFTHQTQCVGIVVAECEVTKQRKAYIGVGKGDDEQADIHSILNWGAKLTPGTLGVVMSLLQERPSEPQR